MAVVSSVDDRFQIGFDDECEQHSSIITEFMEYFLTTFPQFYNSKLEALTILVIAYQQYDDRNAWPSVLGMHADGNDKH